MSEPKFADPGDEDLPRTLRRAKAERAQATGAADAGSRPAAGAASPSSLGSPGSPGTSGSTYGSADTYDADGYDDEVTVRRFDVPFFHLMGFGIKVVLAAIPALILLGAILYGAGQLLKLFFPALVQMEILIRFPN
ncbi:MAG: hypothetical protein AAFQ45_15650 [Pseudomonadota bacterium]